MISIRTRQAYSEVDAFLEMLNDNIRNQVPEKLRYFFKKEKDLMYNPKIYGDILIDKKNLKKETLVIIAMLNLKYWCKDDKEKERLLKVYGENDIKNREAICMKLNAKSTSENINPTTETSNQKQELMLEKQGPLKKFFMKIVSVFSRRNK